MFITKADLLTYIIEEELNEISRNDNGLIDACIISAIGEARGYLYDSFDVNTIFSQTGSNRHAMLIRCISDIALYDLVSRCQIGQLIDDRKSRYDRSVGWLKAVAKTDIYADLPRRPATSQTHIKFGSNTKRNNYF
jgi:phage gp36-like protein